MHDFLSRINGRILIIIAVVLIGILGVLLVVSSPTKHGSAVQKQAKTMPKVYTQQPSPTPANPRAQLTHDYLSDTFAVSYPTDWKGQKQVISNGQQVTFIPSNVKITAPPIITIATDTRPESIADRVQYYKNIGFQQSNAYAGGQQWIKVSGNTPVQSVFSTGTAQKEYETDLFTTYQGQIYTITYKYESARPDPLLDATFATVLSSFQFF